ncbi:ROK family protein [Qipengyuania aquimaris]|nr:ROK family protein [Qipengyuania aquimaris]
MFGGIEAGGTKFVLAVASSPSDIIARHEMPTRSPDETLAEVEAWFRTHPPLDAIGIASFGPAIIDLADQNWGRIGSTPKPGWSDCDVAGFFRNAFGLPVGFDTDVNGAALAEARYGAGRSASSLVYVTVGTGIGGGLVINGKPVHGAAHPEMGHIFPRRHASDTSFKGICPAHGDCLEGLACGPAIIERWGHSLSELPDDHEALDVIASYIAQLCHSIFAITSAEMIVLGGGVMNTRGLFDRIHREADQLNASYFPGTNRHTIARPGLEENSGLIGALLLAERAAG